MIGIQETHLDEKDKNRLNLMWRFNYQMSPSVGSSGGCLLLYDGDIYGEVKSLQVDKKGRMLNVKFENNNLTEMFVVVHTPNNHDISFFINKYNLIEKSISESNTNEIDIYIMGDFNLTFTEKDSVNRIKSKLEEKAVKYILDKHNTLDIIDAYRTVNEKEGYTWIKSDTASRLDMVFVNKNKKSQLET